MTDLRQNYEVAETLFAQRIQARMDELHMSIKELADETGSAYETIRKIVRGLAFPSKYMVRTLAQILQMNNVAELLELSAADKLQHKFGGIPSALSKHDPSLAPLERLWPNLTDKQRDLVVDSARQFAKKNRERRLAG